MRDPARIDRVLVQLREWLKVPDWRLGQIIVNAVEPKDPCSEIFLTEDERLEKLLARMFSGLSKMMAGRELPENPAPQS